MTDYRALIKKFFDDLAINEKITFSVKDQDQLTHDLNNILHGASRLLWDNFINLLRDF